VIGRDLADKLKTRVGKRVIVLTQAADGHLAEIGLPIVGLFGNTTGAQDEFVFTGLATAQSMVGAPGELSVISYDGAPGATIDAVTAKLRAAAPGLDTETWMQLSPLGYAIETFGQTFVGVWLLIVYVLMAIGIVNTQLMAVFERTREFGLLQALGMKPGMIVTQVMIESLMLIGLGVLVGIVLMLATLAAFSNGLDFGKLGAGAELVGGANVVYPKLDPGQLLTLSLVVWILGAFAAWWPARRAARASPVAAMGEA
jgi:ABC-type lipoprotein release transport system permease subunit